jgi:hypothetical protein
LVRADAMILSAALYVVAVLLSKQTKQVLLYSAISLLLPIAHLIFRLYYYGDFLPNTAYLKTEYWPGRYAAGLRYVLDFGEQYILPIGLAVIGSLASRKWSHRILLGIFLVYAAYIAYVGGDAFENFRFFVPVITLLMTLAFLGIRNLGLRQAPQLMVSMVCLVSIPLIIPGYSAPNYDDVFFPAPADIGNIRIGLLLKQNSPVTSKVAGFWAGSSFYFSERYGIDMLGKSDPYVAHLPVTIDEAKVGHNKFDFDYSLGALKPDFVISNFKLPVTEEEMQVLSRGEWAFVGQLYINHVFRDHCLPNAVGIETWHTVFVCDWSPEMRNKDNWKELAVD